MLIKRSFLDLCEEESLQIRVMAIRALAAMCKSNAENVDKVAFVLSQIVGTAEDAIESRAVRESFLSLLDIKLQRMSFMIISVIVSSPAAITALLAFVPTSEAVVRSVAFPFMMEILNKISIEQIKKDLELQKVITAEVIKVPPPSSPCIV